MSREVVISVTEIDVRIGAFAVNKTEPAQPNSGHNKYAQGQAIDKTAPHNPHQSALSNFCHRGRSVAAATFAGGTMKSITINGSVARINCNLHLR